MMINRIPTATRPRTYRHQTCPSGRWGRDAGVRRWRQLAKTGPEEGAIRSRQVLPGSVVWAHVPFTDRASWKTRPAVVLSVSEGSVTLLPGYSSPSRWRFAAQYLELRDLDGTGLLRPTGLRRKPVTVEITEVGALAGRVGAHDWGTIRDFGLANG